MFKVVLSTLIAATVFSTQAALAETECTQEAQDKWMSEMDMQKKIVNDYGYVMYKFKTTDGNCYEIYGMGPKEENAEEMQKIEVYFNPIDGEIVKKKIED
ncbi:MAG: PepSY domain-containing protein [Thiolinea sp.]